MNNLQLHFLSSILHGKREMSEEEASIRISILKLTYLTPPFLVAEVAPYYVGVKADRKDSLIRECADYIGRFLKKSGFSAYYIVNEYDNVQIIITNIKTENITSIEEAFFAVRNKLQLSYELDAFIGIGSLVWKVTDISASARDAEEMLAYKYTYAEQGVVNIKNVIRFSHSPNYASDIHFDRVIGCFQDGNIGKLSHRLEELIENVRNKPNVSKTAIKRTFIELTVSILHLAANADVDTGKVLGDAEIYQWILDQQHTEILSAWFISLCEELHSQMQTQRESAEKNIVQSASLFINENIERQDLGLSLVSESVGLSPYYFSKLFKKEKGIGLSNFISNTRIDHAKELLVNTVIPLSEVALQSGFSSAPYFSQVFKKTVGSTPGEFRRKARK